MIPLIRPLIVGFTTAFSLFCSFLTAAPEIATQLDLSSATDPAARKFYFETIPGQRYGLWRSTDLRTWEEIAGFPKVADGMSLEHTFAQQDKEFFQVEPIDEQAPTVLSQYPAVDGFAVGRFADLTIIVADAAGIDPASIRLTVGTSGQLAIGAPGLTISGNTITFDSGDAALGAWGATVSATLVAADTLGHTLTHTWSFRLEPEPQTAANVFVFGSPTAQRAGQRVTGPAAALAPAPAGPQKASDPPAWSIHEVLADRIVISYASGGAPSFASGQLICNLAPASESEIFYRRVLSTSDDPVNLKLTVFTEEAELTDFVTQGATSFSGDVIVLDFGPDGTLQSAYEWDKTIDDIAIDLSGTEFVVKGTSPPYGDVLKLTMEELYWRWKTPKIDATLELGFPLPEKFKAVVSGNYESSIVVDAELLATFKDEKLLHNGRKKTWYRVPSIGFVPIYATVSGDFNISASYDLKSVGNYHFGYREYGYSRYGLNWADSNLDLIKESTALSNEVVPFSFDGLSFENSLGVKLEIEIEVLFLKSAGFAVTPEIGPGFKLVADPEDGWECWLELNSDVTVGAAGPLFKPVMEGLGVNTEVSWPLLDKEWKVWPLGGDLVFKSHPQPRTSEPGDVVSFSCVAEGPSDHTYQWYHNTKPIPGQTSRTLTLYNVNSGHAGTYFVRAKAGGQTLDSNSATLTVQTTTPENLDADGDGIPNIHETNTGTWVSTTNRGTDPNHWDSDGDGLSDGVETNTGVYVSRSNTGTNPNKFDTDGDGINDKREIDLGTDPNVPPAPDGFSLIPAGSFTMGRTSGDTDSNAPPVTVNVSAFYMGKYEVTKALWDEVRTWGAANGYTDLRVGGGKAANHPVHTISWFDMVKWCNARSQKDGLTPVYTVSGAVMKTGTTAPTANWSANGYRLPTEAEWEKAARGGVSGKRFPSGTDTISHSQSNFWNNGGESYQTGTMGPHPLWSNNNDGNYPYSSPVGSFAPNGYGLYDMAGNMWEWCWDWYGTYVNGATDPRGPASGAGRVFRGGCWYGVAIYCRAADRGFIDPAFTFNFIGFRFARSSVP